MVFLRICFFLLSLLVYEAVSQATTASTQLDHLSPIERSIECNETGFSPTIKQPYKANTFVNIEVTLGAGVDNCTANKNIMGDNDSQYVKAIDFNSSLTTNQLPYMNYMNNVMCGGSLEYSSDNLTVVYTVSAYVTLTEQLRGVIKRQGKAEFLLKCVLTRAADTLSSQNNWTISSQLNTVTEVKNASDTFVLLTTLMFYPSDYGTPHNAPFQLAVGELLYVRVAEENQSPLFKFVVQKCWSTPSSSPLFSPKDVFFDNECAIDHTMAFSTPDQSTHMFDFNIKAFFFALDKSLAIFVHCDLFICKNADMEPNCVQDNFAICGAKRRKRRSIDDESGSNVVEKRTVSSAHKVVFDTSEIYAPNCEEGYVYDRRSKKCSNEEVMEIKGIYLDIAWNPLYDDKQSEAFRELAKEKGYQLWALLQTTGVNHIYGIDVIRVRKGSVILDVRVKYDKSVSHEVAFADVVNAIKSSGSASSRVLIILKIKKDKTIEYVAVMPKTQSGFENVTLIVVVVVLLLVVFISGITFFKVKELRRGATITNSKANGYDNTAMDKLP